MEKTDREEIFAPLQSFVIGGKQIYIHLKDGHITFCDAQKTNMRSKMLDKLYGINGIVYENGNFQFLEYDKAREELKNVYFVNRKGKIVSHYEEIDGYCRISSDCFIINTDIVPLFNYENKSYYLSSDSKGYSNDIIICSNNVLGEYMGSLWNDWHVARKSLDERYSKYFILDRLGNVVFDAEWVWFSYATDKFRILGIDHMDYSAVTIKAWTTGLTPSKINCKTAANIEHFVLPWGEHKVEILEKKWHALLSLLCRKHIFSKSLCCKRKWQNSWRNQQNVHSLPQNS